MGQFAHGMFHCVGADRVRHLRDGREAFPAMLQAIAEANDEIFLEMYWVSSRGVGARFRDALAARARAGVAVFVTYDGVGSLGLFRSFWTPLIRAGGQVLEIGPVAPWRRRFNLLRLLFRDHRKILVVDREIAFCGGLNLADQWLPREQGGGDWRDDVVEVRGPTALELRALAGEAWSDPSNQRPRMALADTCSSRVWVLANRIAGKPNRRIRRAYALAIRRATTSIDITNPYFLPGPVFLRALKQAHRRGVRVRVLVPGLSDVWLVHMAMRAVIESLARDGIEVFQYTRSILHAKTAIFDGRFVVTGSHNLDAFSWRFDLEANVVVRDADFAAEVGRSFERDLAASSIWVPAALPASWWTRVIAWAFARLDPLL